MSHPGQGAEVFEQGGIAGDPALRVDAPALEDRGKVMHAPVLTAPQPGETRLKGCSAGDFLAALWCGLNAPMPQPAGSVPSAAAQAVVNAVLAVLDSRTFTHLSRAQARPYRSLMQPSLLADARAGRPLRFCYDLGPGYHASVADDFSGLRFAPGLGELLALRQIHTFGQEVTRVYAPGVHFSLVIDNLCAWLTNDVAPERTAAYVHRLAALVAAAGLQAWVDVLAESARVEPGAYRRAFECLPPTPWPAAVSPAEQENVSRFVGRACSPGQAADHLARYQRALQVSEQLLAPQLGGVRLTQRATPHCLGFRSFAGGDVRLQSGEVDLLLAQDAAPRPVLITTRNRAQYRRWPLEPGQLPPNWPLPPGAVGVAMLAGVSSAPG